MTDAVQSFRARVITLCQNVTDACELSDLHTMQSQARVLLEEMGVIQAPKEHYEDLL